MAQKAMEIPKESLTIINYLQSSNSKLRTKPGFLNENRVDYFKGKHAVNALCRDTFNEKNIPCTEIEKGNELMQTILSLGMILKVEKGESSGKKTELKVIQDKNFTPEDFYVWIYQGGQMKGMLMGVGVLLVIFIGVLFPLWPPFMRQGSYYLSLVMMGFLGFLMFLGVVRAILWLGLVLVIGRGGWLFPNLFADMGVIESFFPLWSWDKKKKSKKVKSE